MNSSRWVFAMLVVLLLGVACANDATSGDTGGTLTLRLTTPHADDGAVVFDVTGPPIDSAMAVNASVRLFTRRAGGGSTIVGVVVGVIANGAVVTLQVPDVGAAAGYRARIVEVADRRNALRASLTGYALTVTP